MCIATEESFFILKYLSEKVLAAQETHEGVTEDGIEDAFEVRQHRPCPPVPAPRALGRSVGDAYHSGGFGNMGK